MHPRVLQVVLSLNPGGTERLVLEIAKRLNADTPMAVCCLDESGAWAGELEDVGIAVTSLARRPGFHPSLGRAVAAAAAAHDATLLHAHHYSPMVYAGLARFWRPSVRIVFTEHGRLSTAPATTKRKLATTLIRQLPHRSFAVSEALKRHMVESGFHATDVGVIYNGIDVGAVPSTTAREAARARMGVNADDIVAVSIARLDPVKDIGVAIRAVAAADAPLSLVIIGDGSERSALDQVAATCSRPERIRFVGHQDDARAWLAGADIYVNTSQSEGVSLTILEAMAAALPVAATAVGGTPEVVTATTGVLLPPGDSHALATQLSALAHDSQLRRQLGRAGRQRVENRFTLDRMVQEYHDVYTGLS